MPQSDRVITGIAAAADALYVEMRDGNVKRLFKRAHVRRRAVAGSRAAGGRLVQPDRTTKAVPAPPTRACRASLLDLQGWHRARQLYAVDRDGRVSNTGLQPQGPYDTPDRHRRHRSQGEEPRRRAGADVDHPPQGREARRQQSDAALRLRRLWHHRGAVLQPEPAGVARCRRHLRGGQSARQQRVRPRLVPRRLPGDEAEHLEGLHRLRRIPHRAEVHAAGQARHPRRQRRRHSGRPCDDRAPRAVRRRHLGGRRARHAALRSHAERRAQHSGVRQRQDRGRAFAPCSP